MASVLLTVLILMACVAEVAGSSSCHLTDNGTVVDCKKRGLTIVPRDIPNPGAVISLDLSLNNIRSLGNNSFSGFSELKYLNLTNSQLIDVDDEAFDGLEALQSLHMMNNRNWSNYGSVVFEGCSNLESLHVSGTPISIEAVTRLKLLRNLTLTPNTDLSKEVASLPNLTVLTFAFGNINLTKNLVAPFVQTKIEELAFHACHIKHIENGTFDNFQTLNSLSFACNNILSLNTVIDALSTSANVTVESLALDIVGNTLPEFYVLGDNEFDGCRSAWKNIKQLSLRGTNIIGVSAKFKDCLPSIQSLAFGNNVILSCGSYIWECIETAVKLFQPLLSIDVSYMNVRDYQGFRHCTGCYQDDNYIPSNSQLFPPVDQTAIDCQQRVNNSSKRGVREAPNSDFGMCMPGVGLPRCLSYIKTDGSVIFSSFNVEVPGHCVQASTNIVRYINMSNWCHSRPGKLDFPVYGLDHLEIMDLSGLGLEYMNFSILHLFPKLSQTYLAWNMFGSSRDKILIPDVPKLELLDLSNNQIVSLGGQTFSTVTVLKTINLGGNMLETLDILNDNLGRLETLDISYNRFGSLSADITSRIDQIYGPNLVLDITGNPLKCDCEEIDFIEWIQSTSTIVVNRHTLNCTQEGRPTQLHIFDIDTTALHARCFPPVNKYLLIGVSVGLFASFTLFSGLLYKYRWSIKWRYYKMRYLSRSRNERLLHEADGGAEYSAYIIYPAKDRDVSHWVIHALVSKLENEWGRSVYLPERDDIAGCLITDNIVRGIMSSEVVLWVLSPAFLEDRFCEIAAHWAFCHFGAGKNMILILEERIDEYGSIPTSFVNLMHPNHSIGRMNVHRDHRDGNNLFWSRLRKFVPSAE